LALPLLLLLGLAAIADAPAQPASSRQDPGPYRITVNVDLVLLHVTVRDRGGRFAPDLAERDFEVYEDGARQSIRLFLHEDIPVTVGLVVDHSGSMHRKLHEVMAAAGIFVRSSNQDDEMFVVNFNENVNLGLPGGIRFTNRPDALESAILNAPAKGQTALYDAVVMALGHLQAGSRDKKVLIVISDGADNASTLGLPDLLKRAGQSSAVVYTIGIFEPDDPERSPDVLRQLARATGGEAFFPEELKDVVVICKRVAREIRNQYTIGYVPDRPVQPGTYRSIRVIAGAAGRGKLSVRTRSGYVAGDEPLPVGREGDR
jgi:VWFA-related protein